MSIRKRHGRWQVDVTYASKRYRSTCTTYVQAQQAEADALSAMIKGDAILAGASATIPAETTTLGDLRDMVLLAAAPEGWRGSKAEDTAIRNSRCALDFFGQHTPLAHIRTPDLDRYVKHLEGEGNGPATINRKMAALTKMIRFAQRRGILLTVPHFRRLRETAGRTRVLTDQELLDMYTVTCSLGYAENARLYHFLADTGLRVGEALKLTWADCWYQGVGRAARVTVRDTKNGESRTVPLTVRCCRALEKQRLLHARWPFPSSPSSINHIWNCARAEMGLTDDPEFVPHALRHTFASRLVRKGVPLHVVSKLLGHKRLQETDRYAHLCEENLSDAVQVLEE